MPVPSFARRMTLHLNQRLGSWKSVPRSREADMTTDQAKDAVSAMAGDESAFATLSELHRSELHVHCYRMLASFDEAEDAVQETFLRAWRGGDTLAGHTPLPPRPPR